MRAKLRARLTYANVMATVAVFIALGGSSYAAITITGKNVKNSSLTGKDVKNNSLTGSDIKSIKSGDVSDHSLLAKDFRAGQLPAGQQGPKGDRGATGSSAASMLTGSVDGNLLPGSSASVFTPSGHSTTVGGRARTPNATVVLRDLAVFLEAPPGPGASRTIYIGAVTAIDLSGPHISCTVAGSASTCNSETQTVTLPPNSLLTVVVSGDNTPSPANLEFGYRATTP